jgi:hypothetical protein
MVHIMISVILREVQHVSSDPLLCSCNYTFLGLEILTPYGAAGDCSIQFRGGLDIKRKWLIWYVIREQFAGLSTNLKASPKIAEHESNDFQARLDHWFGCCHVEIFARLLHVH